MTRRSATLTASAVLVVVLAAVATLLPVPYVVLAPGPTTNTLGAVGKTALIRIAGRPTYPTKGHLDLTTVAVIGGPSRHMDLVTALRGWLDGNRAVVPQETVYPKGRTVKQIEQEGVDDMKASESSATTAALRQLGIPVTSKLVVARLATPSPARGKLVAGDQILDVDGISAQESPTRLRDLIGKHKVGDTVRLTVLRKGKRLTASVVTAKAPEDGRPVIGILTEVDPDYAFTIDISLKDVGGPSAGLMFALGIVDKLTPGALNGGAFIAGTGTIDGQGKVGPIGGIPQKMAAAKEAGATVFLVPAGNCAEALGAAPKGLKLVKATTLDTAVRALDALRAGRTKALPACTGS